MKLVLFINSLAGGGAERVISKLANHWSLAGHDVVLVTLIGVENDVYATTDSVKRISLNAGNVSTNLFNAITNNLTRIARLRRTLKVEKPDCVVAFMSTANVLAILATIRLQIPVVASERVYLPAVDLPRSRLLSQRLTYRHAATVVAQTAASAAWIANHLKCRTSVIANSISLPLPRLDPIIAPDEFLAGDEKVILSVGRLADQKAMDQVLHIFAELDDREGWRLVIIGEGLQRDDLHRLARDLSLDVIFIARAGNIQDWYERADIYVSTSQFEGFPNTLLEVMACGCATIAYDCMTGPAELIVDGENGHLVPLNNRSCLSRRLRDLMRDPARRKRLGDRAKTVADRFSDRHVFAQWTSTVAEAIRP